MTLKFKGSLVEKLPRYDDLKFVQKMSSKLLIGRMQCFPMMHVFASNGDPLCFKNMADL